ncbi:hypothetical protein JXB01_04495, partial [Candidatus Micrarchaeota archaeon]|nr:hypothetical protein [Candidatus Micrarchaeota archaeon]
MEKLDPESKIKLYELIINRYKEKINEEEKLSISEIRQRISPYNEFIKSLKEKIISDLQPYSYERHFFSAVQHTVDYIKNIRNVNMPVTFWLSFE